MTKTLTALALVTALVLPAAGMAAGVSLTDEVEAQIRTQLTEQGYEVAKIKTEDGMYEAYAKKDGKKMEIFLDADLAIVRIDD